MIITLKKEKKKKRKCCFWLIWIETDEEFIMEPLCEFCGVVRAVVYCKSDSARLCLQCDGRVHSANSLSRRHLRSLLCDNCNAQPAIVRCMDDKLSLCQSCDWNNNPNSHPNPSPNAPPPSHILHSYSGCPSMPDFFRFWSSDPSSLPPPHSWFPPPPPPHFPFSTTPFHLSDPHSKVSSSDLLLISLINSLQISSRFPFFPPFIGLFWF